ncbi:hypothetical protein EDD11_008364 [Mortierella claussenii]|nr:hypothetical protein EDD11_008364 [Mortierella claussenii]
MQIKTVLFLSVLLVASATIQALPAPDAPDAPDSVPFTAVNPKNSGDTKSGNAVRGPFTKTPKKAPSLACWDPYINGPVFAITCSGSSWYEWADCSNGYRYTGGPLSGTYRVGGYVYKYTHKGRDLASGAIEGDNGSIDEVTDYVNGWAVEQIRDTVVGGHIASPAQERNRRHHNILTLFDNYFHMNQRDIGLQEGEEESLKSRADMTALFETNRLMKEADSGLEKSARML